MNKIYTWLLAFCIISSPLFAQNKHTLGLSSSIGSSSIGNLGGARISNSFGISLYKEFNTTLYYNIGIGILNGGYRVEVDSYSDNLLQGSEVVEAYHLLKLFIIPTTIGVYLNEKQSAGLNVGLVHQYVLNEDIDTKTWGVQNQDYSFKENNPYRLSAQFKLDFFRELSDRVSIVISPFYLRELNIHNFFIQHKNLGLEFSICKKI